MALQKRERLRALARHFDLTISDPNLNDQQSLVRLLGGTATEFPDRYRDASPLTWVDKESALFLIIHGVNDDRNLLSHLRAMVDALHAACVEVAYDEVPGRDHFTVAVWDVAGPRILPFLDTHLDPDG